MVRLTFRMLAGASPRSRSVGWESQREVAFGERRLDACLEGAHCEGIGRARAERGRALREWGVGGERERGE